jgi:hypothetical protein
VEGPADYHIDALALSELRRHVVEQAHASEVDVAERLLGQLASLHMRSESPGAGALSFRPTPATAQLAARAFAALRATEGPGGWVGAG